MILYDGKAYQDDDVVDWETAISIDDSYFGVARRLGLPLPPACFVFLDYCARTDKQHRVAGWYDALFNSAKLDRILTKREFSSLFGD
jgi:hypothetical protein